MNVARHVNYCSDKYSKFRIKNIEEDFMLASEWCESGINFAKIIFIYIGLHLISFGAYRWWKKVKEQKSTEEVGDDDFKAAINS